MPVSTSAEVFALAAKAGVSNDAADTMMYEYGIVKAGQLLEEKIARIAERDAQIAAAQERATQERAVRDAQERERAAAPPTVPASNTVSVPAEPTKRASAILVRRVKGGLRTIDSPQLGGLNLTYRTVWKAMYAMASSAPDRTIKKEYQEIAQAVRRRGVKTTPETVGHAVRYLASIGVIEIVTAPAPVQDHQGRWAYAAGAYRVPFLGELVADEIKARIHARPAPLANPKRARRRRQQRLHRQVTSPTGETGSAPLGTA